MKLHEKLKMLRMRHLYTQQEIADKLGVTRSTVSNFEIGRRKPEIDVLEQLAKIYHVDLNYFASEKIDASELMEIIDKAEKIFNDETIPETKKDIVYQGLMKMYLEYKEGVNNGRKNDIIQRHE